MNMHPALQLDPSSSEPQLDSGVDGPQVPTVHAAPAVTPSVPAVPDAPAVTPSVPAVPAGPAMPPSVPAAPDALNVPADAGGIAGGGVQTTREEKHKVCHLFYASSTLQVRKYQATCISILHAHVMLSSRQQYVNQPPISSYIICSTLGVRLMPLC